jgi:hypothetical protein
MREWMEEHEYESVEQLKGSMSQKNCPEPGAFERAQYMRALQTFPVSVRCMAIVGLVSAILRESVRGDVQVDFLLPT